MRKLSIFLLALPLLMLAACSTDKDNAPAPSTQTYTMTGNTGSIESRVIYKDVSNTMYCRWEEGDIVTLTNAGGDKYDFVVKSVDADGVGTMAYDGVIPSADNFTGTATYAPRADAKAGIQTANDNTEHLKYGEAMVATLTNQKIDGAKLTFSHPSTAVYKVTFKAPAAFTAGSKLTMSGAWTEDAVLTLNFSAAKDDIVIAYLIHTAGTLSSGDKMKFTLDVKDGDTYSYTFESKKSFSYEAGKYWLANISSKVMEKEYLVPGYVDLGLPSGTLWATCNLGASKPEEYGEYYGWGCMKPYADDDNANWTLYLQILNSQSNSESDEDPLKDYVYPNNVSIAGTMWDVVTHKFGDKWHMPTYEEVQELRNSFYCEWRWTTENGVNGCKVTSVVPGYEGNYIFFPAAGARYISELCDDGNQLLFWSSSPRASRKDRAYYINYQSNSSRWDFANSRSMGISIRPVYSTIPSIPPPTSPAPEFDLVNLGLSVKWATCNLGASRPEEYGDYYGWGCVDPYAEDDDVRWSLYFQKIGVTGISYSSCGTDSDPLKDYYKPNFVSIAGTKWDAARQNLGGTWRMPTHEEWEELMDENNCKWNWTTLNGVNGYQVTSKVLGYEGNHIFLPATGFRSENSLVSDGESIGYRSSTPYGNNLCSDTYGIYGCFYKYYSSRENRSWGYPIRPVSE